MTTTSYYQNHQLFDISIQSPVIHSIIHFVTHLIIN